MPDSSLDDNIAPAQARPLAAFAATRAVADDWPEIDLSILEEERAAVPPFPLDLLPQPWRDWTSDTASSTAAPVDYVAQTVLAAVAGLSGAGAAVRITPAWCEPLVLWQAMVGEPSTGKSSALAPMRRLLGPIEEGERERRRARKAGTPRIVVGRRVDQALARDRLRQSARRDAVACSAFRALAGRAWDSAAKRSGSTGCKPGMPPPSRSSDNRQVAAAPGSFPSAC